MFSFYPNEETGILFEIFNADSPGPDGPFKWRAKLGQKVVAEDPNWYHLEEDALAAAQKFIKEIRGT